MIDIHTRIEQLRERCLPGHPNPPTIEEYREVIAFQRSIREATPLATGGSKTKKAATAKAKPTEIDSDALLDEFGGM